VPSCPARGSGATIDAMRRELASRELMDEVQLTTCGSLGLCERGPNIVVYPDGVWYSGVTPDDVPEIVEKHFLKGVPVERLLNRDVDALAAEVRMNRDRYLASVRAKDAAGALPDDLQQMIRGFRESRIILTAVELDLFTAAEDGATTESIALQAGTEPRATRLLLDALVSLGLMSRDEDRYTVSGPAGRYLSAGGRDDARTALRHQAHLWDRWAQLTECVRTGRPAPAAEKRDEDWTEAFIGAMHRNASERAPMIVGAAGAAGVRRMLDVGGGSGAYAIAFARANPELHAEVLDLEQVLPITRRHISDAGLETRVTTQAGDLRVDDFGRDFDLVFVSAICHMLDEEQNADLIRRCQAALVPGGRLVIQDFILEPDRTRPRDAALFSINMLVGTDHGRSYAEDEYVSWMTKAGLQDVRKVALPGPTALMVGRR